jgi:acyl-ACP thioesterase
MRPIHRHRFRVRSYETDQHGRLQPPILCKLLQEAATEHAALLGVAVEDLIDGGVAWVLSRLRLEVDRWPGPEEEIVVETWPEAANRLFTERRFKVSAGGGEELASASTLWLVLDLATRRPVRLPALVVEALAKHDLGRRPARPEELDPPDPVDRQIEFTVRRSDLDLAGHVNNTSYIEWAVEAVDDEVWMDHDLSALRISYLSECHHGETVVSQCSREAAGDGHRIRHRLVRQEDGVEVVRASTGWRRKGQTRSPGDSA